jgi:hypothetical protein
MRIRLGTNGRQGSAVLLVLVLVMIMESLIISNTRELDHLQKELRQLDRRQQQKFSPAPVQKRAGPGKPEKSGPNP